MPPMGTVSNAVRHKGAFMSRRDAVIERIHRGFGGGEYPGEGFLQGSFDGCEPYEEVSPFKSKKDWRDIEADFLDAHADALSFFSEGAFRFFLPAYLIADLHGQLSTADPLFHLTHGFSDTTLELPLQERVFVVKQGRSAFVNPRRYGATTFYDYARYRLSVFTREEASAIVAYLRYKRDLAPDDVVPDGAIIDAALETFWLERARTAPPAESLKQHLAEQKEYLATVRSGIKDSSRDR
jgi:hypothetical protein